MNYRAFVLAVLGCVALASCQLEEYVITEEEQLLRDFIKQNGLIDPRQDWNMADLKSVTVYGAVSPVRIYAKNDTGYKLVDQYFEFADGQELTFDAIKGVDEFMLVSGDGKTCIVRNGEVADFNFPGTKTYSNSVSNVFTVESDYREFSYDEVMAYANRLPEGHDNRNAEGIIQNFSVFQGTDKITVYPVYWNASIFHRLGIYWYGENGQIHKQEVYQSKQGDDVQILVNGEWVTNNSNDLTNYNNSTVESIRSRGFTIDLPEGTHFGFYLDLYPTETWHNTTVYSEATLNVRDNAVHAAYFTQDVGGVNRAFIGFEDTMNNQDGADNDLNDLMLIVDPDPTIIDQDADPWIIAAEDLGATNDFDFNDIVFSVSTYRSGYSRFVRITPLAAGGTLAAYLYYSGRLIRGSSEFHEYFGVAPNVMVNTRQITHSLVKDPITLGVSNTYSLSTSGSISDMGGLSVYIPENDKTVTAPGPGEAPQMICVPGSWRWPTERTRISDAYPRFGQWGQNYTDNTWFYYPVTSLVVNRTGTSGN